MKGMRSVFLAGSILLVLIAGLSAQSFVQPGERIDWNTLYKHEAAPQWFRDAKFGIYFHWGVYSVPAFGSEWYPRWMHFKNRPEYRFHVEHFGEISEFGYHDFVPMFRAEYFDPNEWAELFLKAGARFAGPVAEHHDGYSMWDSDVTPWNVKDTGPKRDITGELAQAVRARGMKLITTFHHSRNLQRPSRPGEAPPSGNYFWGSHYPRFSGWPMTSEDPKLRMLYGNLPEGEWLEKVWKAKLFEVIDKYRPDIIWFDSWLDLIPDRVQMEFLNQYFRSAAQWGKQVVVTTKNLDMPREVAVEDFEKGRLDRLTEFTWLTDDTISKGSWCYTQDLEIKPTSQVLHSLIDIVSKNGVLLLNISPMANGRIPENQQQVLLEIGEWLDLHGEAIYDTRPWIEFGEGPTRIDAGRGGHFIKERDYTPRDIRYTRSKDGSTIYAIVLGWPGAAQEVGLTIFDRVRDRTEIRKVSMIGSGDTIQWKWTDKALVLTSPGQPTHNLANVFRVEVSGR